MLIFPPCRPTPITRNKRLIWHSQKLLLGLVARCILSTVANGLHQDKISSRTEEPGQWPTWEICLLFCLLLAFSLSGCMVSRLSAAQWSLTFKEGWLSSQSVREANMHGEDAASGNQLVTSAFKLLHFPPELRRSFHTAAIHMGTLVYVYLKWITQHRMHFQHFSFYSSL